MYETHEDRRCKQSGRTNLRARGTSVHAADSVLVTDPTEVTANMALQHATPMQTRSSHYHESDQIDDNLMHLLCAATGINRAAPLDKLLCPNVLLTPAESAGVEGALRKILLQNSKALTEINISGSTLPCQACV